MATVLIVVSVGLCLLILPKILLWLRIALEPTWKKKIPGPPPTSLLLGALSLLTTGKKKGDPFFEHSKLQQKYGNVVLVRGGLLVPDIVLVADQKHVVEAMSFDRKGKMYDNFRVINDNDLLFSDGAYWHKQRKLINPMFSNTSIKGMYHLMVEELRGLKNYLAKHDAVTKSMNISDLLQRVALDVLTAAAFGTNFGALDGANRDAISAISDLFQEAENRSVSPVLHRLSPFANLRLRRCRKLVLGLARNCLETRRNDPEALANRHDLLNMMLGAEDDETGAKMTEEEIISEIIIFLIAGHETTAHSLTWVLYHTGVHTEWKQRIHDEVDKVLKGKEFPEYDDLSQMTVLDMVIKESMRMTSVTPGGSIREISRDVQFGEYFIPKGTAVWMSIHVLNHNEETWANHNEFNPERFADNQSHYPKFAPFSLGPRNCIGQTFAKVEMRAVLGTIAKYYDWRLDPTREVVPFFAVTQKPENGLYVYLDPRQTVKG